METVIFPSRLPTTLYPLVHRHRTFLAGLLAEKLTGIYAHGSVATGGFVFSNSDFDYLVVLKQPLDEREFDQLANFYGEENGSDIPANGIEVSFVLEQYTGNGFVYPTPFEFHAYTADRNIVPTAFGLSKSPDPDLATHFMLTYLHGLTILGPPVKTVFSEVPPDDFLSSIKEDCSQSYQDISTKTPRGENCIVPRYAVLNYCRTLAYLRDDVFLSKVSGGKWGLQNLPEQFQPLIAAALAEQEVEGSSESIPGDLLVEFAEYAREELILG